MYTNMVAIRNGIDVSMTSKTKGETLLKRILQNIRGMVIQLKEKNAIFASKLHQ